MMNLDSNREKLLGFITSDGKKHLGYYTPVVNPCGDYNNPEDYKDQYTDVEGKKYDNVIGRCEIYEVECFYWDEKENDYKPLPAFSLPKNDMCFEAVKERQKGLFSEDLLASGNETKLIALKVRIWLFLNARCTAPVYVGKDWSIHSEGPIEIIGEDTVQVKSGNLDWREILDSQ